MPSFKFQMRAAVAASVFLSTLPLVNAHGQVNRVIANGVSNDGPNQYYSGDAKNAKTVTRVMYKSSSPAYNLFGDFTNASKMSCEGSSNAPAPDVLKVTAGSAVQVFWQGATSELLNQGGTGGLTAYNPWVHAMGPIMDYITSCNGDCTKFDATNAGWTKIAEMGIDASQSISSQLRTTMTNKPEAYHPTGSGLWAMAKLVQDGSKWDITIPKTLANGQYIIRHELAAVHNPKSGSDATTGPQNYIACIQVEVTGGGSATLPAGTKASELYDPNGDFANFNVYSGNPTSFKVPGPALWDGASSSASSSGSSSSISSAASPTNSASSSDSKSGSSSSSAKAIAAVASAASSKAVAAAPSSTSASNPRCKKRNVTRRVPKAHRKRLGTQH